MAGNDNYLLVIMINAAALSKKGKIEIENKKVADMMIPKYD